MAFAPNTAKYHTIFTSTHTHVINDHAIGIWHDRHARHCTCMTGSRDVHIPICGHMQHRLPHSLIQHARTHAHVPGA